MKASLKFREDQRPLIRAKVPVAVLGFPFVSGIAAGESHDLRFDLATGFSAGPSLRLSYRPNDHWNPFTIAIKSGTGFFGSPAAASMAMSAEFSLLPRASGPRFCITFKPRFGDFSIKKSASAAAPTVIADGDGKKTNGTGNGFAINGGNNGARFSGVFKGAELTACSLLPLRSSVAVKFRWGVRIPAAAEIRTAFDDRAAGISLPKLVTSKISVEHAAQDERVKKQRSCAVSKDEGHPELTCVSVRNQLNALWAENGLLKRTLEELRAELRGNGGKHGDKTVVAATPAVADAVKAAAGGDNGKRERWNGGRPAAEVAPKAGCEDVNAELRKALIGGSSA